MPARDLMRIGRFARACRLSVKALRHYDELGLLRPAVVDAQSGYRYYTREQARPALMIGMLRSLDLPLPVIERMLAARGDELASLLEGETSRLEAELEARRRALLSLRHLTAAGRIDPHEVSRVDEPALPVVRIDGVTHAERLVVDTTELVYAAMEAVAGAGIAIAGPVGSVNRFEEEGDRIEVSAFVAVPDDTGDLGRALRDTLAATPAASVLHEGPYETLGIAHHVLHAHCQEQALEARGPIWEFYENAPHETPAEALRTRVSLPLR